MTQNSINNSASSLTVDNLFLDGNTISSTDTNGNIIFAPDGTGIISVTTAAIVPSGDRADSLGSATNSWDNVYLDGLTFDDGTNVMGQYLTGTFTPTIAFGGASVGVTYSTQQGKYWKIGLMVFYSITIVLTSKGSSGGNATVEGLPFAMADGSDIIPGNNMAGVNLDNRGSGTQFILQVVNGGTSLAFRSSANGVGAIRSTEFYDNSEVRASISYSVTS